MTQLLRYLFRALVLVAVQVYLLNKVPHLHRLVVPSLYFVFVLWLPFSLGRPALLLIGFFLGLAVDYFSLTPGLHAAACVLIAYLRPYLISILMPRDTQEFQYPEPSVRAMQWAPYVVYLGVLTFLHHFYLTFLQWLSVGSFWSFLGKTLLGTLISLLFILTVDLLFPRQQSYRTNTA
ncbi:MAG: rod shape-determining protein MreD [Bacteroidetes bacterium]|nr:rod shape-determining protein MreD [Bacteroidota bacterium]